MAINCHGKQLAKFLQATDSSGTQNSADLWILSMSALVPMPEKLLKKEETGGKRLKEKLLESMRCPLVVQGLASNPFQPDTFSQGATRHVLWVQSHRDMAHVKSCRPSSAVWHTDSRDFHFPP